MHLKTKLPPPHCIEFNDLKPDKAFDTFCKLADTLGFEKPTNKEIFTNRINRNRGALITLPTALYAHPDDLPNVFKNGQKEKRNLDSLNKKGGFSVIITLPHYVTDKQKDFVDISDEIYQNLIIEDTRILIIIDKDELAKLKENADLFNATKNYLKGYINALIDNANKIKAKLISESQILEYLKGNDKARKQIKHILDIELDYIKTHHPDFIKKWKYYLEFEKMCSKLDKNANGELENGGVIWITGLAGAGKTTFASEIYKYLKQKCDNVILLDGDVFRNIFGESAYDRESRIKIGYKIHALAKFLEDNGLLVICAVMGLFNEIYSLNRANFKNYFEVFIKCDFSEIIKRDKKGLYSGAMNGKIKNVVGIDIAYDEPKAHFVLENHHTTNLDKKLNILFAKIDEFLNKGGFIDVNKK